LSERLFGGSRHCSFPLNNIRIRVLRKYFLMNASFDVCFEKFLFVEAILRRHESKYETIIRYGFILLKIEKIEKKTCVI
jgi:hypothetical protein